MAKRNSEYYAGLIKMIECSCRAAEFIKETLSDFDPVDLQQRIAELHEIEHEADACKHEMMNNLAREFITPIEREDIIALANELDDITDRIEDTLICIYMFNITTIRNEALKFADIIIHSCEKLREVMKVFYNFRKSTAISQLLIDVNTLEGDADQLYIAAIRRLFKDNSHPLTAYAWKNTFDMFEKCCDVCEHTANTIECIIMKNS